MRTRFVVITPCYNVAKYVALNIEMNKIQKYTNCMFLYINDKSKDNTLELLVERTAGDGRFHVITNENNGSQARAYMAGIDYLEKNGLIGDEDVIVEVDGDDWLANPYVLAYLDAIYHDSNVWMTYGQYQEYPSSEYGGHIYMSFDDGIDLRNEHRLAPFPFSHLKTYKYWLFNKIDRAHLIDPQTNELFSTAWDHALCLPMVEMAGKSRIFRVPFITYIYNTDPELASESKLRLHEQKSAEWRIRQLPRYARI